MENLFYNQHIDYKFDLKGSNRNRYAQEGCRLVMDSVNGYSGGQHLVGYEFHGKEKRRSPSFIRTTFVENLVVGIVQNRFKHGHY